MWLGVIMGFLTIGIVILLMFAIIIIVGLLVGYRLGLVIRRILQAIFHQTD